MRVQTILILLLMGVFLVGVAAAQHALPTAVSPGATRGAGIAIADHCPTFSWGESAGARSYELTVYRVGAGGLEVQPVFTVSIPATALSWTPSLARCLEAGGRYAWSVRAVYADGSLQGGASETFSPWSEPSLFQVIAEPVRGGEGERPAPWTLGDPGAGEAAGAEAGEFPDAESTAASSQDSATEAPAGTKLSVDGNVDAVSFSGSGVALTGVDAETLDGIDSTALLQKAECDAEAELEALLGDVTNVLTDGETAAAATALAADGANCPAGEFAAGVDAAGGAQGCAVPADVHAFATQNTRLGDGALAANTTGSGNTASGYLALGYNSTGSFNTASGLHALRSNTTGTSNTASGYLALRSNTTGSHNTASGGFALWFNTSGFNNTASGYNALTNTTTGSNNTAIGNNALFSNSSGSNNLALGAGAGFNGDGSDNIFIGSGAEGMYGEANTIRIGGTSVGTGMGQQNRTFINGIRGISVTGGQTVVIDASGQLGSTAGGPGSGIDADTLDALDSAAFLQKTEADTEAELEAVLGDVTNVLTDNETATTAAALAADGANCPAGEFAAGVDAAGAAQGCAVPADAHTFGNRNTRLGDGALAANTSGTSNTASGADALESNTGGVSNTAAGADALSNNTTGNRNTASGFQAGYNATTGSDNIFIGSGALGAAAEANTIRIGGTSVGTGMGQQNRTFINGIRGISVTGGQAVVVDASGQLGSTSGGAGSGLDADTLDTLDSTAFLQKTEADTEAELETLLGDVTNVLTDGETATTAAALAADGADCPGGEFAAGVDASGAAQGCAVPADAHAFASWNTRLGDGALRDNTSGYKNTANGHGALRSNTSGFSNTASGTSALVFNTSGSDNTASGKDALRSNTSGHGNTASGSRALTSNTVGIKNTASGSRALLSNTGSHNTASGWEALYANTTGSNNSAFGERALGSSSTGSDNTALGHRAGFNATTGSDNIFIGSGAVGVAAESNTIRIGGTTVGTGTGQQNQTFINGIRGVTTGAADAVGVMIDSSGQLGTVSSSRRTKEDVRDMAEASERLLALRPVTFRYRKAFAGGEKPEQFGLIAEEVAEVFPELVVYNQQGEPETVKYHLLSSLLLNELQKLHSTSVAQAQAAAAQAREIERLHSEVGRLAALEARVRELEPLEARLERLEAFMVEAPWVAAERRPPPEARPGAR